MTVGARLYRVEQQMTMMDKKLDVIVNCINSLTHNRNLSYAASNSNLTGQFYQLQPYQSTSQYSTLYSSDAGQRLISQQQLALPSTASSPGHSNSPLLLKSNEECIWNKNTCMENQSTSLDYRQGNHNPESNNNRNTNEILI